MSFFLIALIFPYTMDSAHDVKTKSIQQEEHWYGCGVEAIDIHSENRFKVCGGKSVFVPAYNPNDESECRRKSAVLLDTVIEQEKKHNFCDLAEDCVAGEVGRIHFHVNKSRVVEASAIVDAKYADVKRACKPESDRPDWSMKAVHKKDSRNVQSYTCEKKVCIPHFKGNLLDWSNADKRDWSKERQKIRENQSKDRPSKLD